MIGEVVAIGYGSQRKEDLSMAVTTVKLDEAAKSRASNLATILQGRMPGVTVQQTGDPMKPASFTIRGRGSKGNDDDPTSGDGVLVVVDGVPNAPYMMEDVETITVLKDAASAAIYGASVGSSGVILITTKKAQSGKLRVDVNGLARLREGDQPAEDAHGGTVQRSVGKNRGEEPRQPASQRLQPRRYTPGAT